MSLGIAMAVTPTSFDYSRASTIVPRKHFQGSSNTLLMPVRLESFLNYLCHVKGETYAHASIKLNEHLKNVIDLGTRDCDEFSITELEDLIALLEAVGSGELAEIYDDKDDKRRLLSFDNVLGLWDSEREALSHLSQDPLYGHFETLSRDSKCTEAVLRYVHHTSDSSRNELHELMQNFPLLPTSYHHQSAHANELGADIHAHYRRLQEALDCHIVVGGRGGAQCPGGDISFCLANCPGVPDPDVSANDVCRETCEVYCSQLINEYVAPLADAVQSKHDTSDPPAPFWGESWQVIVSRNSTSGDGEDDGFRACIRYYDWTRFALRTDCTRNGVTSISLHVNEKLYQIGTSPSFCSTSNLGVTPVSPYWLQQDSLYIGEEKIADVPVYVFDRREGPGGDAHLYKVAQSDGRPVQMLTTDAAGTKNQKDYVNYIRKPLNPSIFAVPENCRSTALNEILSHPDAAFDL